jgi:hypothetical protein
MELVGGGGLGSEDATGADATADTVTLEDGMVDATGAGRGTTVGRAGTVVLIPVPVLGGTRGRGTG